MRKLVLNMVFIIAVLCMSSCDNLDDINDAQNKDDKKELNFIDEWVLPSGQLFNSTVVGGLSGIDFDSETWYMISDDGTSPRFYEAVLDFNIDGFKEVEVTGVTELQSETNGQFVEGTVDPEAIRVHNGEVIWTSEGNINNGVNPFVRKANMQGDFISEVELPEK